MASGESGERKLPSQKMEERPLRTCESFLPRGDLSHNHLRNLIKSLEMFAPHCGKTVLRKLQGFLSSEAGTAMPASVDASVDASKHVNHFNSLGVFACVSRSLERCSEMPAKLEILFHFFFNIEY